MSNPQKKWRDANKDKVKAKNAAYKETRDAKQRLDKAANPDKYLGYHLRRNFGITVEQYDRLLLLADYKCEICRKPVTRARSGLKGQACIDHNHATGAIRGVLCRVCNSYLGTIGDDATMLNAYLLRR